METKICTKCGGTLLFKNFSKCKKNKDGFEFQCKGCKHEYYENNKAVIIANSKIIYEENKETISVKQKEFRKNNKELMALRDKTKYEKNIVKIAIRNKLYRANNKKQLGDKRKLTYIKNKDQELKAQKVYRNNNKEKLRKYRIQYCIDNREKLLEHKKQYKKLNKDIINTENQKRRTMKKKLSATLTSIQWVNIKQNFNNCCAYCGKELSLQQEHFIPLSKGGEYTLNNIIPSCQKCNGSKNNKDFFIWYPKQKYFSKKRETKLLKYLNYSDRYQQLTIV